SATGPVQVGVAPAAGNAFNGVLQLDGGVQYLDSDPTGTFTTSGTVEAVVGGQSVPVLGGGSHTFHAADLLGGGATLAGGKDISVAGADFVLSNLQVTDHDVELQGSLTLPQLNGLSLAVTGNDHVVLDSTGPHLTGLDVTLPSASFSTAGLTFNA